MEMLFTCTTKAQLNILIEAKVKDIGVDLFNREKDAIRIKDIEDISDVNLYILTPEIIKGEFNSIVDVIEKVKNKISGIITSNAGIINIYKSQLNIIGDYKLNIVNSQALSFARRDMGIVSLSLELNRREIKEIMKSKITRVACSIYGKTELMVSEYCPIGSTFGEKSKDKECNGACMKDSFTLVDRMNESFKVMTDNYCRSHILNNVPLNLIEEMEDLKTMGIETFRLDFKDESSLETKNVLDMIEGNYSIDGKLYTKGHYKRGVE